MKNPDTKHTVMGDKAPTLKTLEAYIRKNPKYKVDFAATLSALANPNPKPSTSTTSAASKASSSKTSHQNGVSATNNPKASTTTAPSLPSLEPGEIPKAASSSATTKASTSSSNNSAIANEYENIPISVFSKTGATINKDKFPTIKTLQTYLDKNPDMNVTSNHAPIAKHVWIKWNFSSFDASF
uniref:BRK domain-containing protein n=1 Tax=Panagrolaimus superbus TaxID=310955 RepID=A0A914Y5G0_9BILA